MKWLEIEWEDKYRLILEFQDWNIKSIATGEKEAYHHTVKMQCSDFKILNSELGLMHSR